MSNAPAAAGTAGFSTSFHWAGYTLGFALGGFFDGIILHQILQWHHLLAGLEGGRFEDLRFQIMADGLFHMLMYVIAGAGLWLLWRTRREFAQPKGDRLQLSNAFIGFGVWHVIDGIVSHWMLGIHRIRMDAETPLLWDLLWFFVFGVVFIILGWLLRPGDSDRPGRSARSPAVLAIATIAAGFGAALPPTNASTVIVVFGPGTLPAEAGAAMASAGGRLIWSDPADQVWAVDLPEGASALPLYKGGALLVSNSILSIGCLNWFRG